jgi:hypothetical protein
MADSAWTVVPENNAPAGWSRVPEATFHTTNEAPTPSMWERANAPLIPQIAEAAHAIANFLDAPALDRSKTVAQIRGFLAGATTGTGDVLAGLTSPTGIALALTGLSEESAAARVIPRLRSLLKLPAVQAAQRAVQGVAGAGFAAQGANQALTAPTITGKAQGVVEAATGALGMASAAGLGRPNLTAVPEDAAAVRAGLAQGVPVDLATATGNKAVRGVQFLSDRSLGGSLVAEPAAQRATQAFNQWGERLADQAAPQVSTAEQAGQAVRDALAAKVSRHEADATKAYDALRRMEEDPTNRMVMSVGKPAPVDALADVPKQELRRIVHELDASGYVKTSWRDVPAEEGLSGNAAGGHMDRVAGSGGAKVFHDIADRIGGNPTRSEMQAALEDYLGGGKETAVARAALDVAKERIRGIGRKSGSQGSVSQPELPSSVGQELTRLEKARVTSQDMGLPVDLTGAKAALQPLYDQMKRQMPITQQQSSPGLKAIENILDAEDYGPLSQVDRDLSAIKAVARQHGGIGKMAVAQLDRAVRQAAANGGPMAVKALEEGRQATIAKYQTQDVLDALPGGKMEEPVAVFNRATAPKDAGIEFLRAVKEHTPDAVPQIARAKLEDLLAQSPDKAFAEWQKLGAQTRAALFPSVGHAQALEHLFLLQKRMSTNANPSGTAYVASLGVQGAAFWTNPIESILGQTGAAGLSAALHSPAVTRALTRVVAVSQQPAASGATRAAALASLAQASRSAGGPALVPAVGQADRSSGQ